MLKKSRVRYLGMATAALLAVVPNVMAPMTLGLGQYGTGVAQAAKARATATGVQGTFEIKDSNAILRGSGLS